MVFTPIMNWATDHRAAARLLEALMLWDKRPIAMVTQRAENSGRSVSARSSILTPTIEQTKLELLATCEARPRDGHNILRLCHI